ncbi:MAG: OmpA family protein [Polyangiales bacterium]
MPRPRALCLALLLAPLAARAQGFSASRFTAPPSADDLAITERALVTPHLRVGASLVAEYTYALSTRAPSPAVEHRGTAHATVSVGLFDRLQLAALMPVMIAQELQGNSSSLAPGDLRLDARVRLAGLPRRGWYRLALALGVAAPTGDASAFAGDGAVTLTPRVIFEATYARDFVFALNLGAAIRPGWEHQLVARAGFTIPLVKRTVLAVEAGFEARAAAPGAAGALSLELLGGVRHVSRSGVAFGVSAGAGAVRGDATADLRAVATIGFAPQPPPEPEAAGDRDADGVLDPDDRCPDEPMGARPDPDARGCPIHDQDHDGFRDEVDLCPRQPPGDDPDPRRMGCPNDDRDHDGVRDAEDTCPLEPAGDHPDPAARGCPDPDPDRDGILNALDACPLERGPASNDRATHGCPRVRVQGDRVVIPHQPRFAINRAWILPESVPLLTEVAAALEAHPELVRIEVRGHTDDVGSPPRNLDLSERRAQAIRQWLVAHGIAPERIVARGYGESVPIADNATAAGRALNRRVEFVIVERRDPPTTEAPISR